MTRENPDIEKVCDSEESIPSNKAWANHQLVYGIRLLEGDPSCGGGTFGSAILLAISLKQSLECEGWFWQAERLENWINLARANHGFLTGKYHSKQPLRPLKEVDSVEETEKHSKDCLTLGDYLGGS